MSDVGFHFGFRKVPFFRRSSLIAFSIFCAANTLLPSARGAATFWVGGSQGGIWEDAGNWDSGIPEGGTLTGRININPVVGVQMLQNHTLEALSIEGNGNLFLRGGGQTLTLNDGFYSSSANSKIVVNPSLSSAGNLLVRFTGANTTASFGTITAGNILNVEAGASQNLSIARVNSVGTVILSGTGTSNITLGLGTAPRLQVGSGLTRVTISSVDASFGGGLVAAGTAVIDLKADYTKVVPAHTLSAGTLQLSTGGKIFAAQGRTHLTVPNMIMAGGELIRGASDSTTFTTLKIKDNTASKITYDTATSSYIYSAALQYDTLGTGTLLIRGDSLSTGSNDLFLGAAPTMFGSGAAHTTTAAIVKQVVVDTSKSGAGSSFATFNSTDGIRALASDETSATIAAGANVRLVGSSGIGTSTTINSLTLVGSGSGIAVGGAPLTITSGMVLSTGTGTNAIQTQLKGTGALTLFTAADTLLQVHPDLGFTTLVKSGSGKLSYQVNRLDTDLVITDGTFYYTGTGGKLAGDVTVAGGGVLQTSGSNMVESDSTISQVTIEKGGTWDLGLGSYQSRNRLLGEGKVLGTGTGPVSQYANFEVRAFSSSDQQTLANQFSGNLRLTIYGGHTILTNGANDYIGATLVQNGSYLEAGADNVFSKNSKIDLSNGGELRTNSWNVETAGLTAALGNVIGSENGPDGHLTLNVAAADSLQFNGALGGHLIVSKTGLGTQALNGSFGKDVQLEVSGGKLTLNGSFEQDSKAVRVGAGGTLVIQSSGYAPEVKVAAGGTLQRDGIPIMDAASKQTLTFEDGRQTSFSLLRTYGFANYTSSLESFIGGSTVSDILHLDGLGGQTFVLEVSFNPADFSGDLGDLRLGWLDGAAWVEATAGNTLPGNNFRGIGSFESLADTNLGDWGLDLDNNTIWAVLNHNSAFAVIAVPEPSTYFLLLLGGFFLLVLRKKKARKIKC